MELLIVIVVIGILAAISVVAYNGISQSAKNTAAISAAKQVINAINMHIAETGEYPASSNSSSCLTITQACTWTTPITGGSELRTKLTKYSSLPDSIPDTSSTAFTGIIYQYNNTRKFNNISKPAIVLYVLNGINQKCQLPNLANGGGYDLSNSTNGRTDNNNGATVCVISIDGPGV